ncbi:MAG: hypothetical protein WA906_05445, partial [Pacificimonas sp.]
MIDEKTPLTRRGNATAWEESCIVDMEIKCIWNTITRTRAVDEDCGRDPILSGRQRQSVEVYDNRPPAFSLKRDTHYAAVKYEEADP